MCNNKRGGKKNGSKEGVCEFANLLLYSNLPILQLDDNLMGGRSCDLAKLTSLVKGTGSS